LLYKPALDQPLYEALHRDNFAFQREPDEAARLYQSFFDETIVQGERQQIVQAVRNTWSQDQAEAAWGAVDDIEIYLLRQEVQFEEHGDWAEVELFEVYQNQTSDRQEVIYYFNLPESAVLTGVWLGNTPERSTRFEYQIASRGAAQAVYRNETREMRDPALLEQIGPRQYRLRVFPVMPVRIDWDENRTRSTVQDGPPLYMWMTYRTLASDDGWPMPSLAVKRNVFWDRDTERLLNGSPMVVDEDAWLPTTVPAIEPVTPRAHYVLLPGNQLVMAVPVSQVSLPSLPGDLRVAVVLDRSRSMAEHADLVIEELSRLKELAGPGAEVDVYLTSSPYRGEDPSMVPLGDLDLDSIMYFGGQNAAQLLAQFEELRSGDVYDSVLVFTDGSGYELGESQVEVPVPSAPIWMVHLGSDIPLGYDDDTLASIQSSGGGVVGQLDDALTRLAVSLVPEGETSGEAFVNRDLVDGYMWTVLPADGAGVPTIEPTLEEPGFNAFAARRLILSEMQRQRGRLDQLVTLDYLHVLAQEYGIVTPYSSMIVLVNEQQRQLLESLEGKADRFQREFEDLTDTVPSTPRPLTGVPEPHEWLLIGLAVVMLLWVASRQRVAWQSSNQVRS
jgi:putative PEP-CTERM system integral membrane protein